MSDHEADDRNTPAVTHDGSELEGCGDRNGRFVCNREAGHRGDHRELDAVTGGIVAWDTDGAGVHAPAGSGSGLPLAIDADLAALERHPRDLAELAADDRRRRGLEAIGLGEDDARSGRNTDDLEDWPDEPQPAPLGHALRRGERTDAVPLDEGQAVNLAELRELLMQIAPARPGYHVGAILGVIVFEPDEITKVLSITPEPPGSLLDLVVEPATRLGDLVRALRSFPLPEDPPA